MKLLILFGPPAVGKLTVANILESKTDYKVFHNHMILDATMHIFGHNSAAEDRLSRLIRENVIKEAADAKINLIFTYVWNFSKDKGRQNIDSYKQIYESRGGTVQIIELQAPLETRVQRASNPTRWQYKSYASDSNRVASEGVDKFTSPTPFFFPALYHHIDTSDKTPEQIANEILQLNIL